MMLSEPTKEFILPDQTCQRLTLAQIQLATHNFNETLVIGRGGFGKVYISLNKFGSVNEVAIKRLHSSSSQGANEFESEVKILSKLRHGNLVPLIGYCNEGNEMVLVYEFMSKGTLEDHIHIRDTKLSWLQLLNICIGAARGLDYLHTGTSTQHGVIHRDVKTSNILLDSNFDAKISDFGLAKVGPINQTRTHVSTLVKGTFGYMDPCYFYSGNLTRKSDVYAFGVVLFEMLSGKQAVDPTLDEEQWSLAVWAQDHFKAGRLNDIINRKLTTQVSKKGLKEFVSIAVQCLHIQPKQRPTMAEVVVKLESILSEEKEIAGSGLDNGKFFDKVRHFFTGKADLMPGHADGSKSKIISQNILKSNSQRIKAFSYAELVKATNNFTDYEGWVDELTYDPTEPGVGLAMYVKARDIGTPKLDLKSEGFNHPNLVKLIGYYLNEQDLYCVYELNLSLDKLLFGGTTSLSWAARLKIAVGAAQGLSFLHKKGHPAYTQFKTTCIMVDADYNARLWDFDTENSYLALDSYSFDMDAYYSAPEWFRYQADVILEGNNIEHHDKHGFGVESEIYSFGVVLLEILTGMKVFDLNRSQEKQNLVKWAIPFLEDEVNLGMVMDPRLQDDNDPPKGAFMLAQLVSNCLQPIKDERPLMENILKVLRRCYQETI